MRCDRQPDGSDGHVLKIGYHVLKGKLKGEVEAAIRGLEVRRGRTTGKSRVSGGCLQNSLVANQPVL